MLWGTFWNPQSLPGEHKGTFFMSVYIIAYMIMFQPTEQSLLEDELIKFGEVE